MSTEGNVIAVLVVIVMIWAWLNPADAMLGLLIAAMTLMIISPVLVAAGCSWALARLIEFKD